MEADDVERNGQRVVADMRGTLEKLAQRIESLKKAKVLMVDQWVEKLKRSTWYRLVPVRQLVG